MAVSQIKTKLNEIFGFDLRSLALFRVGLALVIIADLIIRFSDAKALYSDEGILPRTALIDQILNPWYWSVNLISGQPFVQVLLFLFAIFVALLMLIGYRTRLATIATWALIVSIHNRNPALIFAGDDVLRAILFWAMFLPIGAYYSVDNALNTSKEPLPKRILSAATLALIVQQCFIYMLSVLFKHQSPLWWPEGTAVYYALSFDQYGTQFGQFLLSLPPWMLKFLTFKAFWFELLGPLLIFIPFRTNFFRSLAVVLFILLHLSFGLCFTIGIFSFLSIATWFAFIPSPVWDTLTKKIHNKERANLRVNYDADCGFCKKVVHFLRTFLILPGTPLLMAQDDLSIYADMKEKNSWVVVDWQEKRHYKWEAIAYIVSLSPVFFPLAPVLRWKPIMLVGTRFYETIATNRKTAGKFTAPFKYRPLEVRSSVFLDIIVLILLALTTFWNLRSFANGFRFYDNPSRVSQTLRRVVNSRTAQRIDWFGRITRLDQGWSIFAPNPPRDDGWHVISGKLKDGTEIDLLTGGSLNWDKPSIKGRNALYRNMQWRTYFINLSRSIGKKLYPYYGNYLCREWNAKHKGGKQLDRIDIYFMDERTVPSGEEQNVEKTNQWQQSCVDKPN